MIWDAITLIMTSLKCIFSAQRFSNVESDFSGDLLITAVQCSQAGVKTALFMLTIWCKASSKYFPQGKNVFNFQLNVVYPQTIDCQRRYLKGRKLISWRGAGFPLHTICYMVVVVNFQLDLWFHECSYFSFNLNSIELLLKICISKKDSEPILHEKKEYNLHLWNKTV